MKKVMCFAVSIFMLVNLSFAATLSFRPVKNIKVDRIEKIKHNCHSPVGQAGNV